MEERRWKSGSQWGKTADGGVVIAREQVRPPHCTIFTEPAPYRRIGGIIGAPVALIRSFILSFLLARSPGEISTITTTNCQP